MSDERFGFGAAFVDVDEWREEPRPHRYLHGGFEDSHTLFSFYFPPGDLYRGRMFQYLEGGAAGHETYLSSGGFAGTDAIFDLCFEELGGYMVESNQGHFPFESGGYSNDVEMYGASAESARYSKILAEEMYGAAPHHSYVWGGSGGGIHSIACIERAPDVWDGASPSIGTATATAPGWSAVGYWWLHARHQRDAIVDATSPGGSGNPFATLSTYGRDALAAAYRHGFPRGAEAFLWSAPVWLWAMADMDYYDDFWTTAGFAGHDEPEHMATLLIDQKFTIGTVLKLSDLPPENFMARIALSSGAPDRNYCIRLVEDLDDPTQLFGARIRVLSGAAAGRELHISGCDDGVIQVVGEKTPELFDNVEAGDEIEIDNRRFIAWCHLHQHTIDLDTTTITDPATGDRVFAPEFGGIRAGVVDTIPLAPQVDAYSRRMESYDTGRFEGKMIYVNCTNDSLMWPIGVAAYHRRVRDHLGDAADDSFRLWWVEHGTHGPAEILGPMMTEHKDAGAWRARFAGLDGATDQAMRDLVAWVEVGVAPPENTGYRFNADSGLVLTDGAARGGIQPVVQLTANGGTRTEVAVGETVSFRGTADAPKDAGPVVWAQWDFEGTGEVSERAEIDAASDRAVVDATHAFDRPGTYFVGFRAGVHRHGLDGRGPAVENVAVVRVVVKA